MWDLSPPWHHQPTRGDRAIVLRNLLALLIEIRTEPSRREGPDRNERRGRILDVFDRGVRRRAGTAAATATGKFQSVVLDSAWTQTIGHGSEWLAPDLRGILQ
jgi:hypothetical protein